MPPGALPLITYDERELLSSTLTKNKNALRAYSIPKGVLFTFYDVKLSEDSLPHRSILCMCMSLSNSLLLCGAKVKISPVREKDGRKHILTNPSLKL